MARKTSFQTSQSYCSPLQCNWYTLWKGCKLLAFVIICVTLPSFFIFSWLFRSTLVHGKVYDRLGPASGWSNTYLSTLCSCSMTLHNLHWTTLFWFCIVLWMQLSFILLSSRFRCIYEFDEGNRRLCLSSWCDSEHAFTITILLMGFFHDEAFIFTINKKSVLIWSHL